MTCRTVVQMDPLEGVNPAGDTTFMMIEEAQARGHQVSVYGVEDLHYRDGRVHADVRPVRVFPGRTPHADIGAPCRIDLAAEADVVLMRQDPPFHMGYLSAASLLELVARETLVVNDPTGVIASPEKVLPLAFPDLQPATLITRSAREIAAFCDTYGDVVLKPLYGHGGAGVLRLVRNDPNLDALVDLYRQRGPEPFIVQKFLPEVADGDKRILLVDGEPVGGVNRRPPAGAIRSNLVVGGQAEAMSLSNRDREICAAIGPELRRRGLLFVGIDVIGGHMTEINVTSPTGARALQRLSGVNAVARMWDVIEARRGAR